MKESNILGLWISTRSTNSINSGMEPTPHQQKCLWKNVTNRQKKMDVTHRTELGVHEFTP